MNILKRHKLDKINNFHCSECFKVFGLTTNDLNKRDENIEKEIYDSFWSTDSNYHILHLNIDGTLNVYKYHDFRKDSFTPFVKGLNKGIYEAYKHYTGLFKISNDFVYGAYSTTVNGFQHYTKLQGYLDGGMLNLFTSTPKRITFKIKIDTFGSKNLHFNEIYKSFANELLSDIPVVNPENLS